MSSRQVSFNFRKLFSAPQKVINSTAFKKISFKHKCGNGFDLLPGKLLCLKLQHSISIDSLFSQKNVSVFIFGDVSIAEFSVENKASYCLGILLSSGMLFIYEYDKEDRKILYFRIGINVRGAKVSLTNEIITVKSNIDIVIRVKERHQIDSWFQKLCQACTGIEVVVEEKALCNESSVKIRRKPNRSVTDSFKNHFHYIKTSLKLHNSMTEISKNSWNFDQGFLAPLTTARNSNLTSPVVSDDSFLINSNFKITSTVLARISPSKSPCLVGPFVEANACLTQHLLSLTMNKRIVDVAMNNCNLEIVDNLKWGIRVNSPSYRIDIELTSKIANEKWTLAFMKIFSYHSHQSRSSVIMDSNDAAAPSFDRSHSVLNMIKNYPNIHRCLSQPGPLSETKCCNERLSKSCPLLTNIYDKMDRHSSVDAVKVSVDTVFTNSPSIDDQRLLTKRTSSCLDFPIPIIPDRKLSKPLANSSDSSCSETTSIYDEMEATCCDFERHFKEENCSTPLPIRCKKHGIATRIRRSCQLFTKKLTKSTDLGKIDRCSKYSFLRAGIISNKFKSEDNLQRSGSRSGLCKLRDRGKNQLQDISRSVYDIRGSRCFVFGRDSIDGEILEDDGECESDEYEVPVPCYGGCQ